MVTMTRHDASQLITGRLEFTVLFEGHIPTAHWHGGEVVGVTNEILNSPDLDKRWWKRDKNVIYVCQFVIELFAKTDDGHGDFFLARRRQDLEQSS